MKEFIKQIAKQILYYLHHRKHEKFYRCVIKTNGIKNRMVDGEKEWIDKWRFGSVKASPTQYRVFSHYIGPDINIVPEDVCHDFIEPILNPFRFVGYYSDKNVFDKLFPKGYMPKTLFRRMNGFYYNSDYQRIKLTDIMLHKLLNLSASGRVIIKPSVDGMSGRGVQMIGSEDEITTNDLNIFGNNFIVQEAVEQSDYISQFNPSSVNTLRLSVYRSVKDDSPHVTGAIMRIGGKGSVVDNAHAGGCYVGIHKDGTFCHEVLDQYGQRRRIFNEIDFSSNFQYPNWEQVIEFGKSVCQYVPHHRLLALDIVLDKTNKPHLIEFNVLYYSTWLFQYTTGPAFGKYTNEILDYCKEHISELEYQLSI